MHGMLHAGHLAVKLKTLPAIKRLPGSFGGDDSASCRAYRTNLADIFLCNCLDGCDASALRFCAQERAALPGAPMARRVGEGKSAGWPAGMRASFPPVQGR